MQIHFKRPMLKSLVMTSAVAETGPGVLRRFDSGEISTLVVVGKLREGYDSKYISAVV